MKSLRELVNMQTLTGESDFEIIYEMMSIYGTILDKMQELEKGEKE